MKTAEPVAEQQPSRTRKLDYLRFLRAHEHLSNPFGNGWFALKAEAFARFWYANFPRGTDADRGDLDWLKCNGYRQV